MKAKPISSKPMSELTLSPSRQRALKKRAAQARLLEAVANGDAALARQALDEGADPNKAAKESDTPFMAALRRGRIDVALALWERAHWSSRSNGAPSDFMTSGPLWLVASCKQTELLERAKASCPPAEWDIQRDGALELACGLDWGAGVDALAPGASALTLKKCAKRALDRGCHGALSALARRGVVFKKAKDPARAPKKTAASQKDSVPAVAESAKNEPAAAQPVKKQTPNASSQQRAGEQPQLNRSRRPAKSARSKALADDSKVQSRLAQAVQAGDLLAVGECLALGADPNQPGSGGDSPLSKALRLGKIDAALALGLWERADWSWRAMSTAGAQSLSGLIAATKRLDLLRQAAQTCPKDEFERQRADALEVACCLNWAQGVAELAQGATAQDVKRCWGKALERGCSGACLELARHGLTPAEATLNAAQAGLWELLVALLQMGRARGPFAGGKTLLMAATENGHADFVAKILASGMEDPNAQNPQGFTALARAVQAQSVACVQALAPFSDPRVGGDKSAIALARRQDGRESGDREALAILRLVEMRQQYFELLDSAGAPNAVAVRPRL